MKYAWSIGIAACLVVASAVVAHVVRRPPVLPSSPQIPEPPRSSPEDIETLRREIANLRVEQVRMQQELERTQKLESRVRNMATALKQWKLLDDAGQPQEIPSEESVAPLNVRDAAGVADLLGLDPGRAGAFTAAFESLDTQVRAIEAQRAKVSVEGDTTRIEIPAFPEEVEVLMQSWSDRLDALLTAAEKGKYKKYGLDLRLIRCRSWGANKTITIKRSGGQADISEVATGAGGGSSSGSVGPDNETTLAPYRHLLPR